MCFSTPEVRSVAPQAELAESDRVLQLSKPELPCCEQTQEYIALVQKLITVTVTENAGLLLCRWRGGTLLQGMYQKTLSIT